MKNNHINEDLHVYVRELTLEEVRLPQLKEIAKDNLVTHEAKKRQDLLLILKEFFERKEGGELHDNQNNNTNLSESINDNLQQPNLISPTKKIKRKLTEEEEENKKVEDYFENLIFVDDPLFSSSTNLTPTPITPTTTTTTPSTKPKENSSPKQKKTPSNKKRKVTTENVQNDDQVGEMDFDKLRMVDLKNLCKEKGGQNKKKNKKKYKKTYPIKKKD